MDQKDLQNLRQEYSAASLSEETTKGDPIKQFELWFNEAVESEQLEPNAMTLATATYDGRPSARIVLLKGFDASGFKFYTNYLSRKGKEITKNPLGSLLFFWGTLERQVRIEGTIEKKIRTDIFIPALKPVSLALWHLRKVRKYLTVANWKRKWKNWKLNMPTRMFQNHPIGAVMF